MLSEELPLPRDVDPPSDVDPPDVVPLSDEVEELVVDSSLPVVPSSPRDVEEVPSDGLDVVDVCSFDSVDDAEESDESLLLLSVELPLSVEPLDPPPDSHDGTEDGQLQTSFVSSNTNPSGQSKSYRVKDCPSPRKSTHR